MQNEYLTIKEITDLLLIEEPTVRAWLRRGLAHTDEDGIVRVKRSDLDAFLAREGQGQARDAASE